MCFDQDSQPPIPVMAGAAVDGSFIELQAADANRLAAFRADAAAPSGAGMIVLPDVRGLFHYYEELALRFAEAGIDAVAIDYYGRTAGVGRRDEGFEFAQHTSATTWAGLQADAAAAADDLRSRRGVSSLFSIGFCFGGRISFLLASVPALRLDGVVGFYGWPVGPSRNDTPAPVDVCPRMAAPVLGIFGGADHGIPGESVGQFEGALATAGVDHRVITYPGAPHGFFDRRQAEHAEASTAAWDEVLGFVRAHAAAR